MKTLFLLLVCVVTNAADERFIYTTNLVPVEGAFRVTADGKVTDSRAWGTQKATVISRNGKGAVIQFYETEDKFENVVVPARALVLGNGQIANLPKTVTRKKTGEIEVPGETVFVLNLDSHGPGSKSSFAIYNLQSNFTNTGNIYRLFDAGAPTNAPLKAVITTNWNPSYIAAQRENATVRVIAYQLQQASNGLPSFQLEVAKRYLKGDGVPQDHALATHWLRAACTNHDSTASNLLAELRK